MAGPRSARRQPRSWCGSSPSDCRSPDTRRSRTSTICAAAPEVPALGPEDAVPGDEVVGVEPSLGLPPSAVVEDAHDASLDLQTVPARADVAQRADVVVGGEDVVLADGEAEWAQLRE